MQTCTHTHTHTQKPHQQTLKSLDTISLSDSVLLSLSPHTHTHTHTHTHKHTQTHTLKQKTCKPPLSLFTCLLSSTYMECSALPTISCPIHSLFHTQPWIIHTHSYSPLSHTNPVLLLVCRSVCR